MQTNFTIPEIEELILMSKSRDKDDSKLLAGILKDADEWLVLLLAVRCVAECFGALEYSLPTYKKLFKAILDDSFRDLYYQIERDPNLEHVIQICKDYVNEE